MGDSPPTTRPRNDAIDLLRGVVMVLMALDHVRDLFSSYPTDPTVTLDTTTPGLFFTRWVTHFCAPVFMLLAGASAFLAGSHRSRPELARFLAARGLWLVLAELTLVRWGGLFELGFHILIFQVIWVIGVSMVLLAGLVLLRLRPIHIGAIGLALVVGHGMLDGVHASSFGRWGWLWMLVHEGGVFTPGDHVAKVFFPLVPWVALMPVGYAAGVVFTWPAARRRRFLLRLGVGMVLAFVALRGANGYGDPRPWTSQRTPLVTLFSFLACRKHPASLCYLLMTLGPALAFLGLAEGITARWARPLVSFGRVPFFYYLLHVPLIHAAAVASGAILGGAAGASAFAHKLFLPGVETMRWGFSLPVVYVAWALVVFSLYPVCRWFAGVKARRRAAWLSYL